MISRSIRFECFGSLEGAAVQVLSFLDESNQQHLASLASEKRKVILIGEEHDVDQQVNRSENVGDRVSSS